MRAGSEVNLNMNIDEHIASALAFSRMMIVQPSETFLIFDLIDGRMEFALLILSLGEFEIKFTS